MGYFIRILGTNLSDLPIADLRDAARPALLETDGDADKGWRQLVLKHQSGDEIAVIEKNPVALGQLGAEELEEFIEEVGHYKPDSAVAWLHAYLPTVKVIYAFQLLHGTDVNDGWTPLHSLYRAVWNRAGGILQADGEGFSNEDGYTILWQFGERATGPWRLGILSKEAGWVHFEIDLGCDEHRDSFQRGEIPAGATLI